MTKIHWTNLAIYLLVYTSVVTYANSQVLCQNVSSEQIGATDGIVDTVQRQFWGVWGIIDNFAVITSRRVVGGITLVNVTDYTAPETIPAATAYALVSLADGAFIMPSAGYMLVAVQATGSITTINVSSPIIDNLATVSTSVFASSRLFDVWVDPGEEYAAVASYGGEGLILANVSDPTNITLISQSANSFNARSVVECRYYFAGTQQFCTIAAYNQRQVYVYNITNVQAPPLISTIITNGQLQTNRPMGALFHPTLDIVYVYAWNSMIIQAVNVTDPTNHIVGGFATGDGNRPNRPSKPNIIGEDHRIMIFISYDSFMNAYCIADPMNPVLINSIFLDYDVAVAAPYILPGENSPIFIPKNRVSATSTDVLYIRNLTFCGDGILSPGEQCENGTCCDILSCLFESNSTVCEETSAPCQHDSFCPGNSTVCPPIQDKSNGIVCGTVEWNPIGGCIDVEQCIDGQCTSRSQNPRSQCSKS